jgi:hypothetical protein
VVVSVLFDASRLVAPSGLRQKLTEEIKSYPKRHTEQIIMIESHFEARHWVP